MLNYNPAILNVSSHMRTMLLSGFQRPITLVLIIPIVLFYEHSFLSYSVCVVLKLLHLYVLQYCTSFRRLHNCWIIWHSKILWDIIIRIMESTHIKTMLYQYYTNLYIVSNHYFMMYCKKVLLFTYLFSSLRFIFSY